MNHNEAIKEITKAISKRQDTIAEIDDGRYSNHDQISVANLRNRLLRQEINLTESMFFLRENHALESESNA